MRCPTDRVKEATERNQRPQVVLRAFAGPD